MSTCPVDLRALRRLPPRTGSADTQAVELESATDGSPDLSDTASPVVVPDVDVTEKVVERKEARKQSKAQRKSKNIKSFWSDAFKEAAKNPDGLHQCMICLYDVDVDPWVLKCGHVYHEACLKEYSETVGNCPLCRRPFEIDVKWTKREEGGFEQTCIPP